MYSASYIIKAIDQFSPIASKIKGSFQSMTGKIDNSTKSVSRFSSVFGQLKILATGATAYKTANVLYRFSEQMQGVKSVAKETGISFQELEKQAKFLGRTTRYTASEAASGMYFLAKAGYDTQKIYDTIPSTLLLASAANLDLARAADIVTNIMASQQMESKDVGMAVDVLTKAFSSANTDLVQLGEAMKYAGAVSHGMGTDFAEATAALAMMGNAGIQSSMAGTALRGALSRLANPPKTVRKLIKALNLEFYDTQGNLKSIVDIVDELGKKNVNTRQLMSIFGQRPGPGMQVLVSQGPEKLREFTKTIRNSEGFAQKASDIRMEGLYGSYKKMVSALEGLAHTLGDLGLNELLSDMADGITKLSNWLSDSEDFKKIADSIGSVMGDIAFFGGKIAEITWDSIIEAGNKIGEAFAWPVIKLQQMWDIIQKILGGAKRLPRKVASLLGFDIDESIQPFKNNVLFDESTIQPIENKNKIEIDVKINDKNNNVSSVEAKNLSPISNLIMNVGTSTGGEYGYKY